jgi:sugar/nucleoside kinase (ribokinase family)
LPQLQTLQLPHLLVRLPLSDAEPLPAFEETIGEDMDRRGICVAGNMVVDILYPVRGLPALGELTTIEENISRSSGGALCNVIMDLAALDSTLPLTALGRLGTDTDGDFILEKLRAFGNIDLSNLKREGRTSFTMVIADEITKQRTFYHYRGANARFSESDIDWDRIDAKLLHLGYILLLDALDAEDAKYGTKLARLLHNARQKGIETSVDVASETGDRFEKLVPPALKYTNYCVINELEAEQSTGVRLRDDDGGLMARNMPAALKRLMELGVSTWAVIHCPEGGYGMDNEGRHEAIDSPKLPPGYIEGTVGAGDAFCAGVLYAAHNRRSLKKGIELGIAAATCSLSRGNATEGMRDAASAMDLYRNLRLKNGIMQDGN